jgi:hypothetical protein
MLAMSIAGDCRAIAWLAVCRDQEIVSLMLSRRDFLYPENRVFDELAEYACRGGKT